MNAPPSTLRLARTREELDVALAAAHEAGHRIGFVPTMGALHDGHAALVRVAAESCDVVVVSVFVNPLQFGAGEDLDRYPRSPEQDATLVERSGGDVLWLPDVADVYGAAPDATADVSAGPLGSVLEGASRPGHFDGVATVVARLLAAVRPDVLYLGEKDYQQLVVVRRMVRDHALPVEVESVATVREADGLARSSRNAYLTPDERARAVAIPRAVGAVLERAAEGERSAARLRSAALAALEGVDVDYVELVDPETLAPLDTIAAEGRLLLAVRIGTTRLIDNARVTPADTTGEPA